MELEIVQEPAPASQAILALSGRLDAATAPDLKARLKELAESGCTALVVDLSHVLFIDSSGLSALVSGLKATRQAGSTLRLVGLNDQARTAFRLTMLDRVFEFYPDVESALRVGEEA